MTFRLDGEWRCFSTTISTEKRRLVAPVATIRYTKIQGRNNLFGTLQSIGRLVRQAFQSDLFGNATLPGYLTLTTVRLDSLTYANWLERYMAVV